MRRKIFFSHKEELWNAWSHSGGIVLGVVFGTIFLVWCFHERAGWATAGVILYLIGMLFSYITSTGYHALSAHSVWKERLRKWDHAAIYWHIAGSYSPITLRALRNHGVWGWGLFAFVWLCTILGTISSFRKLRDHSNLETLTFIGMGLSRIGSFQTINRHIGDIIARMDHCRGRDVYYWCGVLFAQQKEVYAHSVPLLCPCR